MLRNDYKQRLTGNTEIERSLPGLARTLDDKRTEF